MPELPEVETICRGLAAHVTGRRLLRVTVRRHDLRQPIPAEFARRTTGLVVEKVTRRAKYFLIHLSDGTVVLGHLGMSGRLLLQTPPHPKKQAHDHVVFETALASSPSSTGSSARAGEKLRVIFNDPRRFGLLLLSDVRTLDKHPLLAELGPEPLDRSFTADKLQASLFARRGPLKAALLDQTIIAGLGNIYVSEALFRAALSPLRAAGSLTRTEAGRLVRAIKAVLSDAIAAGGSSISDYVQADGELGSFQNQFRVYDRAKNPCPRRGCRGHITRIVQAGRSTFYCPVCQK